MSCILGANAAVRRYPEIEDKRASAEHALHGLKARLSDAGHEASRELADAADAAERTVEKGKARLAQLAVASARNPTADGRAAGRPDGPAAPG